jgi:sialic acid synthase SpsE
VAEIGNNHQGDLGIARDMVYAAAAAGADAVKFQKRNMDCLFTRAGKEAPYGGKHSFGPTYASTAWPWNWTWTPWPNSRPCPKSWDWSSSPRPGTW